MYVNMISNVLTRMALTKSTTVRKKCCIIKPTRNKLQSDFLFYLRNLKEKRMLLLAEPSISLNDGHSLPVEEENE